MNGQHENIDLQKLSQRELLIVTHNKVNDIADSLGKLAEEQTKHEVRISLVESKVMVWGAVFGIIGSAVLQVIISLFKTQ